MLQARGNREEYRRRERKLRRWVDGSRGSLKGGEGGEQKRDALLDGFIEGQADVNIDSCIGMERDREESWSKRGVGTRGSRT